MPSGKSVEDSYSSELTSILKNKGINATFKKSYNTLIGRQEPDITIELPDGLILIEAKIQPQGFPQAMEQISKYHRGIGATEHIIGTFAVVYNTKHQEAFYSTEKTLDLQKVKTLDDLANYMAKKIHEKPTVLQPVSTQKIIRILDENVILITRSLTKMPKEEIEDIFGGKDFFSTVLDYKEEETTSHEALKRAAAYLLVNQILFYHILSNEIKDYPPIDPNEIKNGNDLQTKYFNIVLKQDYAAIFGFNVASAIKDNKSTVALRTATAAIQTLLPAVLSLDLLGKIFHNLIPLSLRKVVAAYYTNSEAAELLANLAIEKKDDRVFDPSCGSGTLLVASYNRKKSLSTSFTDVDHVRFLEHEIYGSDIMPFAAHLAAVSLALRAPLSFTNVVDVAIHDSTELSPGIKISAAQDVIRESYKLTTLKDFAKGTGSRIRKVKKGVIDLLQNQRDITLPRFDVVIMNPPFTKFQRIPPDYKKKLAERFSGARYRQIVHGQLGLHGYFLLLADKFLVPGGRLAAVLPLTTISLEGFYGIIKLLLEDYTIEHIIVSSGRAAFSENTSLREILLVSIQP